MLALLPRQTQIFCAPAATSLLTVPGQPAPRSPEGGLAGFPPACAALVSAAGDTDWLLYLAADDIGLVRQLSAACSPSLERSLATAISRERPLILAARSPLPESLQAEYSEVLVPFLHRLTAADAVLMPRSALTAAGTLRLADAVLQSGALLEICQRGPNCSGIPGPVACNPQRDAASLRRAIRRILPQLGRPADDCTCIEAGLLLLQDFDTQSHAIVQTMEGRGGLRTADVLHGIMHRREPDPDNAAWWFRRVSGHPAAARLGGHLDRWLQDIGASLEVRQQAKELLRADRLEPARMIELAARAQATPGSTADTTLRLVQYLEILNLLTFPA
ncbi:MAG: hypothetical protein ACKO2P_08120 [Planctomycetota bacterium]